MQSLTALVRRKSSNWLMNPATRVVTVFICSIDVVSDAKSSFEDGFPEHDPDVDKSLASKEEEKE